jgi:hypothetical protein
LLKSLFCWWTWSHSFIIVFLHLFLFLNNHFNRISRESGDKHMVSLSSWPGNLLVYFCVIVFIFLIIIFISLNNVQIIYLSTYLPILIIIYWLPPIYETQLPSSYALNIAMSPIICPLFLTFVPLTNRHTHSFYLYCHLYFYINKINDTYILSETVINSSILCWSF